MNELTFLRTYLVNGILLVLAWPLCLMVLRVGRLSAKRSLRVAQTIFAAALVMPWLFLLSPAGDLGLRPAMQVFSGSAAERSSGIRFVFSSVKPSSSPGAEWTVTNGVFHMTALLILSSAVIAAAFYLARVAALALRLRRLSVIRALRRVRVLAGEGDPVPYSARIPGAAAVVLPLHLFRDGRDLRLITAHELQHHRQGDTLWVHLMALARALYFWNPAVYGWSRIFDRLQELACDAALIGRRRVSPQAYGRCLLSVAETAASWPCRFLPVGTAGMATESSRSFLRRRIEMIMTTNEAMGNWRQAVLLSMAAILVLAAGAVVSRAEVADRRLTEATVARLAKQAAQDAGLPIELNDRVLARLNRFMDSPEKRKKLKEELAAMTAFRPMIESKLAAGGMPAALLALPLFESGYARDLISSHGAAGIWQFVPQTARRYGLKVTDANHAPASSTGKVDERLDPRKETDAAIQYLQDLHLIFGDWRLALTAYNVGEGSLIEAIRKQHTRDPWGLGPLGDGDYLAGAIAMMIIQRNPSVLD